jgi:hypothetical protein
MSYSFTSPDKNYHNKESLNHCSEIKKKLDGIFEKSDSILIVGWRSDSDAGFIKHCTDNGKQLTIVEVFPKNVESIPTNVEAIQADIREYKVSKPYDLFLWQHGPEHVTKIDVNNFLRSYSHLFKYIVLEAPNGPNVQGQLYGNPYEEHISAWGPTDFLDLGFDYITYAGQTNDGFIIGYKINENTVCS